MYASPSTKFQLRGFPSSSLDRGLMAGNNCSHVRTVTRMRAAMTMQAQQLHSAVEERILVSKIRPGKGYVECSGAGRSLCRYQGCWDSSGCVSCSEITEAS
nr:hypothetical protein CFP56_37218 [Quercus suber]